MKNNCFFLIFTFRPARKDMFSVEKSDRAKTKNKNSILRSLVANLRPGIFHLLKSSLMKNNFASEEG